MASGSSKVSGHFKEVSVTPTIDTSAYTAGDHLGTVHTITIGEGWNGLATVLSVTVLDKASQESALDILFFNELPTVASADNAALSIADAQLAKCVGVISIAAGDYATLATNSVASVGLSSSISLKSETEAVIYAVVMSAGTPTYVSTTDLVFTYCLGIDK